MIIMSSCKANKKIIKVKKSTKIKKTSTKKFNVVDDKARAQPRIVDYLPVDVIVEIVARVGATSATDLFRCKLTCKKFHEIVEEKKVLQKVAITGLYPCTWRNNDKAQSYFQRCGNCNNPQALYQLGMEQFFMQVMVIEGIKNLEKAMKQKHKDAIYALSLILMCSGDNKHISKGVELLLNLMNTIKGEGIVELRRKFRDLMLELRWRNSYGRHPNEVLALVLPPKITCATGVLHEIKSRWDKLHYYDEKVEDCVNCSQCKCRREVDFFGNLVREMLTPLEA